MKLTYLGTAAAEGMPAVFCNCEYCNIAKKLGGKNIRTRSQSIINDDLLIDLPADTYSHLLQNGISGHKIKYLFITHSHCDHFYPTELSMRSGAFAHDMDVPVLNVFCSKGAYEILCEKYENPHGFDITLVEPYKKIVLDGYEITPLPAKHFAGDLAVFYIIKGDKTVLYAHDTGYFYDEVFNYIEKEKIYFDMLSLDCTNVNIPISDNGTHMGIPNIERVVKRLEEMGAADGNTIKVINHFSHNANPLQQVLEKRVEGLNYKVAYDGMQIDI